MKTRTCIHCGVVGEESELFSKHKARRVSGAIYECFTNSCKICTGKRAWKYISAKKESDPVKYYTESTWKTLNQRCINGLYANSETIKKSPQMVSYHKKQIELHVSKEELYTFWKSNEIIVKNILTSGGTPTIDRIDDKKHYTLDNMQILDRMENIHKSKGYAENPQTYYKEDRAANNRRAYRKAVTLDLN